jgi:O-antigen ligase
MTHSAFWQLSAPWRGYAIFVACLFAGVGLAASAVMLSLAFAFMAAVGLLHTQWRSFFVLLKASPVAIWMLLLFGWCLWGIFYPGMVGVPTGKGAATQPHAQPNLPISVLGVWLDELRIKLPLLLAPLGLLVAGHTLTPLRQRWLALAYCGSLSMVGVGNLVRYALHKAEIDALIRNSKEFPIVTGMLHIYFSLLVAFAIFWALSYVLQKTQPRWWRLVFALVVAILFVNLHVIAGRTGLLAFWGAAVVGVLRVLWLQRRLWWGLGALGVLLAVPVLMLWLSPSLQHRMENTFEDINAWRNGEDITHWSISRRLAAWETAIYVGAAHPLLGVGPANLELAMDAQYARMPYRIQPGYQVYTHNQYLEAWLAYGLPGILLLLLLLHAAATQVRRHPLMLPALATTALAMLVEAILERQVGVSFVAFFFMLFASVPPTLQPQSQTVPASA